MAYASGKKSQAISDRSGQAFPYTEMVKEWNGSLVHISEFEAKHPQLNPPYNKPDAIALQNTRSQKFQQPTNISGVLANSGGITVGVADLTLPGEFAFSSRGMEPNSGSVQNRRRQLLMGLNNITVVIT
jgi:hypothetical protein